VKPRLTEKRFRGLELMFEFVQKSALPWHRYGVKELAAMEAAELWLRGMREHRDDEDSEQ
jgi:hypothetical protein